jgi:D-amino peptidase
MLHHRLYISADIEGVAGVVSREQALPEGFEYQQAREWMTNEVIAACEAAFECGIQEIVISDSHGKGQNLLLDKLPPNVQLVRSWPRPLCMMEGIEQGQFDGALLLGYHPGATDLRGVLSHTLSGVGIKEVKLNGKTASETVISAATAAHFNVPVIMVSGDDAYAEHARSVLDDVETATVKWACSTTSTRTLLPQDACEIIRQSVKQALGRLDDFRPYAIETPVVVDVDCTNRKASELLAYLPMFKCTSATGIQFEGKDMIEVSQALMFLIACGVLNV